MVVAPSRCSWLFWFFMPRFLVLWLTCRRFSTEQGCIMGTVVLFVRPFESQDFQVLIQAV